jgi:hypothetical protein
MTFYVVPFTLSVDVAAGYAGKSLVLSYFGCSSNGVYTSSGFGSLDGGLRGAFGSRFYESS